MPALRSGTETKTQTVNMALAVLEGQVQEIRNMLQQLNGSQGAVNDRFNAIDEHLKDLEAQSSSTPVGSTLSMFHGYSFENPRSWLSKYEAHGNFHRWDNVRLCAGIPLALAGLAETWYRGLTDAAKNNFEQFKNEFLAKFKIVANWSDDEALLERKQRENETVESYLADVQAKCHRLNKSPEDQKMYLLRGLRPSIKVYVLGQKPKTVEEVWENAKIGESLSKITSESTPFVAAPVSPELAVAIHRLEKRTDDMMNSIKKRERSRADYTGQRQVRASPRKYQDPDRQRPENRFQSRNAPRSNRGYQGRTADGKPICNKCKQIGHIARTCGVVCYRCDKLGHFQRDCIVKMSSN